MGMNPIALTSRPLKDPSGDPVSNSSPLSFHRPSIGEVLDAFRSAMIARGLIPPDKIKADGLIHRCDVDARHGRRDGTYKLYLDKFPAGGFRNWRDGQGWENWSSTDFHTLSPSDRAELARQWAIEQAIREERTRQERCEAALLAAWILQLSAPASPDHQYARNKGVGIYGVRTYDRALVVPIRDVHGDLHSVQFIYPSGRKLYLEKGRVEGCFFTFPAKPDVLRTRVPLILVTEGWATGYSVWNSVGYMTVVAFDAGNLEFVAKALRSKYPGAEFLFCADDDWLTAQEQPDIGNPGVLKAGIAANAVNGRVTSPCFDRSRYPRLTDFNDLEKLSGSDAVRRTVEEALSNWLDVTHINHSSNEFVLIP